MATLTVQTLPANGAPSAIAFAAADVAGDEFTGTGRELVAIQWGAAPSGNVQVEGVPSADSGRDGTSVLVPGAPNTVTMAGPLKPRNWNDGGVVKITYPSGIVNITVAAIRFTTG